MGYVQHKELLKVHIKTTNVNKDYVSYIMLYMCNSLWVLDGKKYELQNWLGFNIERANRNFFRMRRRGASHVTSAL